MDRSEVARKKKLSLKQHQQILGENIQRVRILRGKTQEDMAEYEFDVRHLRKVESGKGNPTAEFLYRLAIALDTTVASFYSNL